MKCINPRCRRKLGDDSPSMYYCSRLCQEFHTPNGCDSSPTVRHGYRSHDWPDPMSPSMKHGHQETTAANVHVAFDWLDVRAR